MAAENHNKPIFGITMGDGAGVGPEIIVKTLADERVYARCRPFVIGDAAIMRRALGVVRSGLRISTIGEAEEARFAHGEIDCLDLGLLGNDLPFGRGTPGF